MRTFKLIKEYPDSPKIGYIAEQNSLQAYWVVNKFILPEIIEGNPEFWMEVFIKPEPKVVPFTYEDYELFLGKVIKLKDGSRTLIVALCDVEGIETVSEWYTYKEAFDSFTFLDNSPFGKTVNE
jgi:hypothetical protein